jgi:hypothetical protein
MIYPYKDADRDWWRITLDRGDATPNAHDPERLDFCWYYSVEKQDSCTREYRPVFSGTLDGQGDQRPLPSDVMRAAVAKVVMMAVDVARHDRWM